MGRLSWSCASLTDVGRVRTDNEDSVFCSAEDGVFVVADGMGGHAAGEVASAIASEVLGGRLCATCADVEIDEAVERFRAAFLEAGSEIRRQAAADETQVGMGTTATVLVLRTDDRYIIGHIGDSRAYLLRGGILSQVTRDHSWVQEQVDRGVITPEQARHHPRSNIITRALGTEPESVPDIYVGDLRPEDRFLLASDGLTDMLPDLRIAEILEMSGGPESAVRLLVDEANRAGGFDNITALAVYISGMGGAATGTSPNP